MLGGNKGKGDLIKNIYLYLVLFATLMMMIISGVGLIKTALSAYVFTQADVRYEYREPMMYADKTMMAETATGTKAIMIKKDYAKEKKHYHKQQISQRRHNELATNIAVLLVVLPVFLLHWRLIQRKV